MMSNTITPAKVIETLLPKHTSDGDGVKLKRVFGGRDPHRFDPFLMMDEFGSDASADYIGGFPPHPHRGFETITIMLNGKMEHRDHLGNIGLLNDGDVQWMTAGKGVIHAEMPQQTEGLMRGFQFWLNLPAAKKLQAAKYQDIKGEKLPTLSSAGSHIRLISGQLALNDKCLSGYVDSGDTEAVVAQITIQPHQSAKLQFNAEYNAMLYPYEGDVLLGVPDNSQVLKLGTLSRLQHDGHLLLSNASEAPIALLLLAGKPIGEPIAQHGPFVMNSFAEIEAAIAAYRDGTLTD